jgi:hypothetical protein
MQPSTLIVVALLVGLLLAFIARSKGYSFLLWWSFGTAIWIFGDGDRDLRAAQREDRPPVPVLPRTRPCRRDGVCVVFERDRFGHWQDGRRVPAVPAA